MQIKHIFQASAVASALVLAGCGGDINISEGDIVTTTNTTTNNAPTTATPTTPTDTGLGEISSFLSSQVSAALGETVTVRTLSGRLIPDAAARGEVTYTLTNDTVWALEGPVFVGNDNADTVTLEIEPGTIIFGRNGADYLVVSRGSEIVATGTATQPIIMTSYNDVIGETVAPGQWGGLVLLGNAPSTKCPATGDCSLQVEGAAEGAVFGGTDEADSSGTLNYLVVKYAGFEVAPDNELNGITFGGVGSGTTVDYVQVHGNSDDGVEFFGGTVNAKHLVLTANQDDSVDWDNGYKGKLQYVFVQHATDNSDANRGIEGDGDGGDDAVNFGFSSPMVANMTIIGNTFDGEDDSEGLNLRDQTGAQIMNLLVTGPAAMGECLEFDHDATVQANLADGGLTMTHSVISCSEPFNGSASSDGSEEITDAQVEDFFLGQVGNQNIAFADRANLGLNIDGTLTAQSALLTAGGDPTSMDSFFDTNTFVGAVGTDDWRQGWAFGFGGGEVGVIASASGCPANTTTITPVDGTTTTCQVSGRLTADLTLTAGNHYALSGAVFVGGDNTSPATLTVEPGVIIYGSSGNDYLVVSRGSQINANGTATAPITFTSKQHAVNPTTLDNGAPGQWGGLVILGNAPSTKCPATGTCSLQVEGVAEGAVFGGTALDDNSGTLRYVRVMHGGFEIAPDNELNGITFGGVGSGTTVEYVQVHKNADDGVEFFGGTVNAKYLVLTDIQDDSVDWDNGYKGKLQFVLAKHAADNSDANRGIEGDGDGGDDAVNFGFSSPTVANMTIIGNDFDGEDDSEGLNLRDQTGGFLYNFVITGSSGMGECLEFDHDATVQANLADGGLTISTSVIACTENFNGSANSDATQSITDAEVEAFWNGQTGNAIATAQADVLSGVYTVSPLTATDMATVDSFFTTTDFVGAIKDANNDWTAGWTVGL